MNRIYGDHIGIAIGNVPKKNLNIIPYLNSLKRDEQIEFLDKLVTTALKTGNELCSLKGKIICDLFDENILGNLDLYFSVISAKFWSLLESEHDNPDSCEIEDTRIKIQHALVKFSVEKINMLYAVPLRLGSKLPIYRSFCKKSQQKLLENIAIAWVRESNVDESKQYMNALISSVMNEYGNMATNAVREMNRDFIATTEKIVQAIEMCGAVSEMEKMDQTQQKQLNALIQTLAIGWLKPIKDVNEILKHIKRGITPPDKK